jgi:hypothetical protein
MAARISIVDLAEATGIAPDVLAAEVTAIQATLLTEPRGDRVTPEPPAPESSRHKRAA